MPGGSSAEVYETVDRLFGVADDTSLSNTNLIHGVDEADELPLREALERAQPALSFSASKLKTVVGSAKLKVKMLIQSDEPGDTLAPLTDEMAQAVHAYTQDTDLCPTLNKLLCDEDRGKLKPLFCYLRLLLTGLERLPSESGTFYRGVDLDLGSTFKKGKMVVWWSVTSVTGNIEVMDTYLKSKKKTIFSIAANNAKNVRRYSAFPKEEERIIPPGTVFVVESILTISPGVSMVQLKQDDTPSLIDIGEDIYAICDPSTDPADGGDEESYATIELEAGNAVGGEEWYMGKIASALAEKLVMSAAPGAFLVRESESKKGNYTLSVNGGQTYTHYRINQEGGAYFIAKRVMFTSIKELIEHYTGIQDGLCIQLTQPCPMKLFAFEIDPRELQFETALLGEGEFGECRKALWGEKGIEVAVKVMLEKKADDGAAGKKTDWAPFAAEAFIADGKAQVGLKHEYVVQLLGVVQVGEKMLVTEYMPMGPINMYLKGKKKVGSPVPLQGLLLFIKQIAEGMLYLETKKVVHRYLAARSILVKSDSICKIANLKTNQHLFVEDYYATNEYSRNINRGSPFEPLAWYAPECIYRSKFTSKSDVWSYGVCSWEILSHGKKPYSEFSFGIEVVAYAIEGNGRLACPAICPDAMYSVLQECWTHKMKPRPDFAVVLQKVTTIYDNELTL